jgi:hypothetical protein
VHERKREVEAPLHPARITADLAVGCVRQPDASKQLVAAELALLAADAVQR